MDSDNDSEAPQKRRRFESDISLSEEIQNLTPVHAQLIEDNPDVLKGLQMFSQNRISVDNVFNLKIIDSFDMLLRKHHNQKKFKKFQFACRVLEASSRIYGMRVDVVYNRTMRLFCGLKMHCGDDNAEEDSDIDNDPAISEPSTSNSAKNAAAKKTRKKRALVSTITKNKETINAKLRTSTMIDPLLAKWNQMPGDISSPNKLFSAMLRTVKSDLSPNLDEKYFDASENMRIEFSSDNTYNFNDYECDQIEATLPLDQSLIIRQTLKGFEINEIPVADSLTLFSTVHRCEIEVEVEGDHQDDFDPEQLDFTFDANAATEEATDLRTEDNLPCGDHEDASDDENTEEDDFVGCQRSEYAYEHVTWTGSPHWKFLRTMPKPRLPDANNNNVGVSKRPTNQPEPIPDMEVGTNDDTFISSTAKRTRQPRIRVHWDAQNLQMPPNFCIPDDFFECLPNSKIYSSDPIRNEKVRTQCRKKLNEEYIQPASEDDANDNDNFELGNDHEGASNDDPMVGNQSECVPHTQTTGQSSKTIVKQTQMITSQIEIKYAKRDKVVDMKQLQRCSLRLIEELSINAPDSIVMFDKIYAELPKILAPQMAKNLSHAIGFHAILHLCNDKGFRLKTIVGDSTTFGIDVSRIN